MNKNSKSPNRWNMLEEVASPFRIRAAGSADANVIFEMMNKFALEIGYPNSVTISINKLEEVISARDHDIEFIVILAGSKYVGFGSFMERSISFRREKAIYIEDIYIEPDFRKNGLAKRAFGHIADVALSRNILRLEWLAANGSRGLSFSDNLAGQKMIDWIPYRLCQEQMHILVTSLYGKLL